MLDSQVRKNAVICIAGNAYNQDLKMLFKIVLQFYQFNFAVFFHTLCATVSCNLLNCVRF